MNGASLAELNPRIRLSVHAPRRDLSRWADASTNSRAQLHWELITRRYTAEGTIGDILVPRTGVGDRFPAPVWG
jgi:hypothetical protein